MTPNPIWAFLIAPLIAGILSAAVGALFARFAPLEDWSSMAWWIAIPLVLLVDFLLEAFASLGTRTTSSRIVTGAAVLTGFYAAWFILRQG